MSIDVEIVETALDVVKAYSTREKHKRSGLRWSELSSDIGDLKRVGAGTPCEELSQDIAQAIENHIKAHYFTDEKGTEKNEL